MIHRCRKKSVGLPPLLLGSIARAIREYWRSKRKPYSLTVLAKTHNQWEISYLVGNPVGWDLGPWIPCSSKRLLNSKLSTMSIATYINRAIPWRIILSEPMVSPLVQTCCLYQRCLQVELAATWVVQILLSTKKSIIRHDWLHYLPLYPLDPW